MASITPLARGLRGRCPNCGKVKVRDGFWEIDESCSSCAYNFVREDGYWAGAMTVLMALVILGFFVGFMTGVLITWPDVPWETVGYVTIAINTVVSLLAYSWAKTIWVGLDLSFNPSDDPR